MDDRSTVSGSFPFDTLGVDLSLDDITDFTEIMKDGWTLDPFGDVTSPRYLLAKSRNNSSNSLKNLVSDNSVTNSNNHSRSSDASSSEFNRNDYLSSIAAVSRESQMARRSILMSPKTTKKKSGNINKTTTIDSDDGIQGSAPPREKSSVRDKASSKIKKSDPTSNHPSLVPTHDDSIHESAVMGVWQTMTSVSMFGSSSPPETLSSTRNYKGVKGHRESKKKSKVDKSGNQSSTNGADFKRTNKITSANSSRSSSSSGDPFLVSDYNECEDQYSDFDSEDDLGSMHSGGEGAGSGGKRDEAVGYEKAYASTNKANASAARGRSMSESKDSKRSQSLSEDSNDAMEGYMSADNPLDEKAKEKSRYHAKNTRMRKKNYIESIREKIKFLTYERDQTLSTRKQIFNRMLEDMAICRSHLSVFLRLMLEGETSHDIWHHIVEPHMLLIMPVTPNRSYPPSQLREGRRHIFGVKELAAESCSFSVFVQSIGDALDDGGSVLAEYDIDESSVVFENNVLMCKFFLVTSNAVSRGARKEICHCGMIYAKFSSQNKMQYMELAFDVWGVMHELRLSSGRRDLQFFPNTLALACCESPEMRIVVSATQPHSLLFASASWIEQSGYAPSDIEKLTLLDVVNISSTGLSKSKGPGSPGGASTLAAVRKAAAGCASAHSCALVGSEGAARYLVRLFPLAHCEEAREVEYVLLMFVPVREVVNYMYIEPV